MTKLLVVSHPCAFPVKQRLFADLQRLTGWQVTLVIPANWRSEYGIAMRAERNEAFSGALVPIPVWLAGNIPLHAYRSTFLRLLKQERPDAIYADHDPYTLAVSQVYIANWLTLRRPIGFHAVQNIAKRYPLPFRVLERFVFKQSKFSFPVTEEALEVIRSKGYSGPAEIVPFGIDLDVYRVSPEAERLRKSLKREADELLVGFVGRVVDEKGLGTLLRAAALVDNIRWRLVVVGSGSLEDQFDALARELGISAKVNRLGYVPHEQAPAYLGAFDVLVLPSETRANWKEQFGRVLIEALACGTPVLGSNSGAIPEVIESTGGGLIFPEGDPDALAAQLRELLLHEDKRRRLAEAGRQRVLELYSQEALAGRMAAAIERAIAGGK